MSQDPAPWTTVARTTLVDDRWLRLHADECQDSSGRTIAPYYVMEYADWVSVLAVDTNDKAIVVEEYRHGAEIVAIGAIGGGVEAAERPQDAASRELLEEIGCVADEIIALGATWANFGNQTNQVHHFLALNCRQVGKQSLDESESIAVHTRELDGLGVQLAQSYHQLTWYKAMEWIGR